jgi:hypothetical protein
MSEDSRALNLDESNDLWLSFIKLEMIAKLKKATKCKIVDHGLLRLLKEYGSVLLPLTWTKYKSTKVCDTYKSFFKESLTELRGK